MSYKAREILSTILSLPDDWDYTLTGMVVISKDGVASVRAGINGVRFKFCVNSKTDIY